MADLLTSSYHAIGNYGAMYGCVSYSYDTEDDYYRVYIYWLGEGLKTTESDAASPYSLTTSATIKGEILVGGTSKASWTATASGTRSGNATYSKFVWFQAGGSYANYFDVTRTSSAQTVTIKVTYTVSGYSARTGTATFTVPAKAITYTDATITDNGTTAIVDSSTATLKWKGTNGTNNAITQYTVQYDSNTLYTGTGTSCTVSLPDYGSHGFTVTGTATYNTPRAQITITRPQKILMEPCAWARISSAWQPVNKIYVNINDTWKELDVNNPYYVDVGGTWEDIY